MNPRSTAVGAAIWVAVPALACSPVTTPTTTTPITTAQPQVTAADTASDLPPTGYGSLRQDEFSVEIRDVNLHVKVTPLSESIIRLAAPDTYRRLRSLVRSRWDRAIAMTDGPEAELFLVSFFSRDPNVAYRPEELRITHRGDRPVDHGLGQAALAAPADAERHLRFRAALRLRSPGHGALRSAGERRLAQGGAATAGGGTNPSRIPGRDPVQRGISYSLIFR